MVNFRRKSRKNINRSYIIMKEFKIRGSACGQIMTNPRAKKDIEAGLLSKTAKTYCETWLKEQLYNRKKEFTNKYVQKGLITEDESLDFVADFLDYGMLIKNEKYFEDDFMTGTPDAILKDVVIDVKNSWDNFTFPLFETEIPNKDYYWQAQCYMYLTGKSDYKLIYVLSDTPIHLIEKEAYYWCQNNGYEELDIDIHKEFINKMTYNDIDDNLKIKIFDIKRNDVDIEKIKERVWQCRSYISKLIKTIK